MNSYKSIQVETSDPVCTIKLNRPETLNAFTYDMLAELRSAIDAAVEDEHVVGIVITGMGRGFSSGLDAGILATVTESEQASDPGDDELPGLFSYFLEVPKPIVAAVNGVAAGGGFILAMMSDIRIASDSASFITIFLKRGLVAEHGSTWLLPRLVGVGRALDLLWTSDRIDAAEAHRIGLVEHITRDADLLESAHDYVRRLAEAAAPASMAETKRMVYRHLGMGYREALQEIAPVQNRFAVGEDAKEGARALLEKRSPTFKRLS